MARLGRFSGRMELTAMTMMAMRMLGACAGLMAASWTSAAVAPVPQALRALEAGEWELRGRGEGAETQKLCVSDPRQLLQVRHGRTLCSSFTISDSPNAVSVNYDCAAAGNGRTDLRVETAKLIQIRSQGIANGAPFAFSAEGRHVGSCGLSLIHI